METPRKVIIIGAGVGGTATAARLSKKGFQVEVYEKNSYNGGRCSLIHHNGYRFDQGPSLYLMPKIFEETFQDLGEDIKDHIELLQCETNYKIYFHDGLKFENSCNLSKLQRSIEQFEGEGEDTLLRFYDFMKETHVHYHESKKLALQTDFQNWYDLVNIKHIPSVLKLHLHNSVYTRASKYFKSKYMRMAFTFQTMYMGMSPYDGVGAYNLLQYTEIAEGIWYPKGGFNKVLQSFENIAVKYGAKFNYNSDVEEIIVDDKGVAKGIKFKNGDVVNSDIIICNADLVYAYNKLLPKTPYAEKLGNKKLTSSSISFYWSMNQVIPQLNVHNIFLAEHFKPSFDQIFEDHTLPDSPSFYVNVPSRIDPTAAPEGKDSVVVLVPVGHISNNPDIDFDKLIKRAREQVVDIIEKQLKISNFNSMIDHEFVNDPRSWQSEFNLWKGSALGLSHTFFQVIYFRPSLKCKIFDNLYFVGASVQPGTGVPIVLCGAKLLEKQLCDKFLNGKIENNVWAKCLLFLIGLLALLIFWFFFN
ncbi:Amine oxidase,Carotenoid/retinoid oxidoreductase,FAD/NAD(P)-binding domain [Cinara cedri]|uniref:Phytoene desaturase n=1 Tax=Cinara cedri TaxID=506608 RepID=A0A5E4NEJ4_9HEMI|nr:Amine oxidase,Carotenoid/retinoid oxidoreductase,FAD/NAD(P)-binding domain [Cinara cedri]